MIDATTIEPVTDYESLIEAFRAVKARLGLSNEMVDELGGLTRGHTEKILGPSRTRKLSDMTFDVMMGVLAIKLEVSINMDAVKRMESRWEKRNETRVRKTCSRISMKVLERAKPHVLKDISKKLAEARKVKISPEVRKKIARRAAKARWRRVREKRRQKVTAPPIV